MKIILASKSPRRQEILRALHLPFRVFSCEVDETLAAPLPPRETVMALAERKRAAAALALRKSEEYAHDLLLCADTVVALDGAIYGKPHTPERAREMLRAFSGREHEVWSGIAMSVGEKAVCAAECTRVTFAALTDADIEAYLQAAQPYDKAGAYGIQGEASLFIEGIRGDYFNVVGLPVRRMAVLARETFGLDLLSLTESGETM